MFAYGPQVLARINARLPVMARVLFWIEARDRSDNSVQTFGFWNGADHQNFTINAVSRLYYAAGDVLTVAPLEFSAGLTARSWQIAFSGLSPEVLAAVRQYDVKHCPVEAHQVFFDPDTETMLDTPIRRFKGQVSELPIEDGAIGGSSTITLKLVNDVINLTRNSKLKKSDESYKRRSGDRIFKYADVSGTTHVVWGQHDAGTAAPTQKSSVPQILGSGFSGIFG